MSLAIKTIEQGIAASKKQREEDTTAASDDEDVTPTTLPLNLADMMEVKAALCQATTTPDYKVSFSGCDFTNEEAVQGLADLITKWSPEAVTELDLGATKFACKSDFSTILAALQVNTTFAKVNLSNYLCSDYVSHDGSHLQLLLQSNKTLQSLDLSGHSLCHQVVVDLVQGLKHNRTLTELRLHNCSLDETSAATLLAAAATSTSLQVLDLGANNQFSPAFLNQHVAALLRQAKTLNTLILDHSSSMFQVPTAQALSPFLTALQASKTLTSLSLRYCRIQTSIGRALLQMLTVNDTLLQLDLEFAGFGLRDKGNEILLEYLPQFKALQELKIIVQYPKPLVPKLIQSLQQNKTLQKFHPRIHDRFQKQQCVKAVLERNQRLAQARSLLLVPQEYDVPAALLPAAVSQLAQNSAGSAAAFQVLQHWIAECL